LSVHVAIRVEEILIRRVAEMQGIRGLGT
jgi:hypothetical protein